MRTKHENFALEALVKDAEPYMRSRYEAEDIRARPLPPVRVESQHGFDIKPIREILERIRNNAQPIPPPPMMTVTFNTQQMGPGTAAGLISSQP